MKEIMEDKKKYFPLTHAQKRIYYDDKIYPDAPWVNLSFTVKYKEEIEFKLLSQAINIVIKKNDGLRLRIVEFDYEPEPFQYVSEFKELSFDLIDFSGPDNERRMREWSERTSKRPFILINNDLFHFICLKYNEKEYGYYVKLHHIITDGWSIFLLFEEINKTYRSLRDGKSIDNKSNPSYIQYISDEQEYLKSEQAEKDREFWHNTLLPLPEGFNLSLKKNTADNINSNSIVLTVPDNIRTMLHEYRKTYRFSLYKSTLTALLIYIARVTGVYDLVISGANHNRSTDDHKYMMGMFVSTILIRAKVEEDMTFNHLIQNVGKEVNNIIKNHQKYPFDLLALELKEISGSDIGYLRNIAFTGHTDIEKKGFEYQYIFPGFEPGALLVHLNSQNRDMDGILELEWVYQIELFTESEIRRFHQGLVNVLTDALANPDKIISEIDILSSKEKEQILYEFNKTISDYPKDKTIDKIFHTQVEKTPDYISLVFQDKQLTYHKLNQRANQLARVLKEKGVKSEHYVGLMVDRSLEMIQGMIAILKSGGAYLPIDPDYPEKRIVFMLEDSNTKLLLTQKKYIDAIEFKGQVINLEMSFLYHDPKQHSETINSPNSLAYSIYTSGSTGNPKGVMIEHYSVINLAFSQLNAFGINKRDRIFQFSSMCFDASVEQIYIALFSGAVLILIDKTTLLDMNYFEKFIDIYSLTHIHAVPLFISSIPAKKYNSLKRIIAGGDVCPQILVQNWIKYCDFCNEYGPTETTVTSIQLLLKKRERFYADMSIGKALNNTYLYVLDKYLRPVPIGVPGELYISGDGVARGYLNRIELTSERFLPDIFMEGERIYKTGDLVRWLPNGDMEFISRIDFQVKIRGFRIETGEIENQLLKYEEKKIKEAAVIAREDTGGEKYLCAYIISDDKIDIPSLSESLAKNLPDYMIPSYFVHIEKIPLTSSGKLDRKALPEPEITEKAEDYAAPRNKTEENLVDIWSQLLHIEKDVLGIDDNFFKLGGHSLKAAVMITQIHKMMDVKVLMHQIFEMPTIRKMAEYIIKEAKKEKFKSIEPAEEKEYYLLTSAQKRLFFIDQLKKDSVLYNIQLMDVYCKGIEKDDLDESFKKLIKRHQSLRTSFYSIEGQSVQKIHNFEEVAANFEIEYWETAEDGMIYSKEPGKEWTKVTGLPFEDVIEHFVRPFDLKKAPLIRAGLIKILRNTRIFMLDMHHIITDGVSNLTLIKDLWALYDDEKLPGLRIQYKDFSEWMNREEQIIEIKKQEPFWLNEFRGEIPIINLPTDYSRPVKMDFYGDMLHFEISMRETHRLNFIAREQGTTLYMVLFAVYNIMLAKLSSQEEIVVGTVSAGRGHADLQPIIGMFVETLAIRSFPQSEKTFKTFLKEIKEKVLIAFSNSTYPFEQLVSEVATRQDKSRNPLFDVVFTLDNEAERTEEYLHDVLMLNKSNPYNIRRSKFDMTLMGAEIEERVEFNLEYNTQLFRENTISRFIMYFKKIISSICSNIEQKISEIEIIPDIERGLLLYAFNDTESEFPPTKTIHELFEEQVDKSPGNIAIVGKSFAASLKDIHLTYRKLNANANQLAHMLRSKGMNSEDIAAIMIEPSQEMIIGLLAILKAGGTFLPIDNKIPRDRMKYILEESGSQFFLTRIELLGDITYDAEIIELDNSQIITGDERNLKHINTTGNSVYIIYTSGSTGKPKGVIVEHRSLINLCFWHNIYYLVTSRDRATKYAGFGFDASVWEIFPYLVIGASLFIVPEEIKLDIKILNSYYENKCITISFLPTQLCEQFMSIQNTALRVLLTGGDKLKTFIKKKYQLYNNYGPTENTVVATSYLVTKFNDNIPIGPPLYNNQLYILDKNDNLQPIGVPGELCISGRSLARGYLNNPELTIEKFVKNPYKPPAYLKLNGSKLYRTGDLARWLANGNIQFLGRIDYQVKIRGFRIELGEIENQLLHIKDINEAFVITREETPGQKSLCAYIVAPKTLEITSIKNTLSKNLPDYMIPSHIVQIKAFPLNPNGKIDTKALPAPTLENVEYVPPTNETEEIIVNIWLEVLGIERVSIDDNFFEIGGDSIKTILISGRLQKCNLSVNVNDIFMNPTIRKLAVHLKEKELLIKKEEAVRNDDIIQKQINKDHETYMKKVLQEKWPELSATNDYNAILLTGATGYLGAHLLLELLMNTKAVIYLLVRSEKQNKAIDRLKRRLEFYFKDDFLEKYKDRIIPLWGNLRDPQLGIGDAQYEKLCNQVDAVLHSAANVKHYGLYEELYKDNVDATARLLEFSIKGKNKDFHHISTINVGFGSISGKDYNVFTEYCHDVGQKTELVYTKSKFEAEKKILEYRKKGLNASIYRAGNITFHSDTGRFQENIDNNAFYAIMKGIIKVGFLSEKMSKLRFDLSFVNYTAKAIVLLLTRKYLKNETYHIVNPYHLSMKDLESFLKDLGIYIKNWKEVQNNLAKYESDSKYEKIIERVKLDSWAWEENPGTITVTKIDRTVTLLRELSFEWPKVSRDHIERMISYCYEVGFL